MNSLSKLHLLNLLGDCFINLNLFKFDDITNLNDIHSCCLCNLSKQTSHRFLKITPKKELFFNNKHIIAAFVFESLDIDNISNSINSLSKNKKNDLILYIIENILGFDKESIFIVPFLKCASLNSKLDIDNQMLNACKRYFLREFFHFDYIFVFSEEILKLLFVCNFYEAFGRLLGYKNTKFIFNFSIEDMLLNPNKKNLVFKNLLSLKKLI